MNVYGIKMAGVFMFSTATILLRTAIVPRWIALLGYALGAILLLTTGIIMWIPLVFPLWVFLVSFAILLDTTAKPAEHRASADC
jgi:Zn-dependent membrane protease YugP